MAKVKIEKMRAQGTANVEEKINAIIDNLYNLEDNLEYILTHLSEENFSKPEGKRG